jgi:hypothetical protein
MNQTVTMRNVECGMSRTSSRSRRIVKNLTVAMRNVDEGRRGLDIEHSAFPHCGHGA